MNNQELMKKQFNIIIQMKDLTSIVKKLMEDLD